VLASTRQPFLPRLRNRSRERRVFSSTLWRMLIKERLYQVFSFFFLQVSRAFRFVASRVLTKMFQRRDDPLDRLDAQDFTRSPYGQNVRQMRLHCRLLLIDTIYSSWLPSCAFQSRSWSHLLWFLDPERAETRFIERRCIGCINTVTSLSFIVVVRRPSIRITGTAGVLPVFSMYSSRPAYGLYLPALLRRAVIVCSH
jgi:hypothetical protein